MNRLCFLAIGFALAACSNAPPPKPPPEPLANARQMFELGVDAFTGGRYREAIFSFHRAERLFLSIDDAHGVATSAISQAETQLLLGEAGAAAAPLKRALTAIARNGNDRLLARARLIEARVIIDDNPEKARHLLVGLLDAPPSVAGHAQLMLCELEIGAGSTACAAGLVSDDVLTDARIELLRAQAALANSNFESAGWHLDRAMSIYHVLAYRPGIAGVHEMRGRLAQKTGDTAAAVDHLEHALYLRLWIKDRAHSAVLLAKLARLADDNAARARYLRWHESVLNESAEPEWIAMMHVVFESM